MDIKIINRALVKLGENPISSINELPQGHLFRAIYDDIKQSLLSMHLWRFSIGTAKLAPIDEPSETPFKYRFQLPSDYLLMIKQGDLYKIPDFRDLKLSSGERYIILGDKIEAGINPLKIYYVKNIEDEKLYSPWFKEAFVAKLASEATVKIHQNPNLRQMFESDFINAITQAVQNNEIIQDVQAIGDDTWVAIREMW